MHLFFLNVRTILGVYRLLMMILILKVDSLEGNSIIVLSIQMHFVLEDNPMVVLSTLNANPIIVRDIFFKHVAVMHGEAIFTQC